MVLDGRVHTKAYGKLFLASVPPATTVRTQLAQISPRGPPVAERPRLDALMGEQAFLAVDQPLDLGVTLGSGQSFRWRLNDDGAWAGVLGHDMVRLQAVEGGLLVESGPTPPGKLTDALAAYLRLDDDLPAIQRQLAEDGRVGEAIAAYSGLRVLRQDPWETLAAFILSQNSNIPRIAGTIEGDRPSALASRWSRWARPGTRFPHPRGWLRWARRRSEKLGCGYRAPYLSGAAAMVASGEVRLDRLRRASYQEAQEALLAILGGGEKVADCVMLFALDQMVAFPVDRWIRRALEDWYAPGIAMTYPRARAWALEQFGPLAGYANQYLFWGRRQGQGGTLHPQGTALDPHAGSRILFCNVTLASPRRHMRMICPELLILSDDAPRPDRGGPPVPSDDAPLIEITAKNLGVRPFIRHRRMKGDKGKQGPASR